MTKKFYFIVTTLVALSVHADQLQLAKPDQQHSRSRQSKKARRSRRTRPMARHRLGPQNGPVPSDTPPRLITGIPKSGTHLLKKVAEALTGTRATWIKRYTGTYKEINDRAIHQAMRSRQTLLSAHLHGTPENIATIEKHQLKTVIIYRDPRDQAVSLSYYLHRMSPRARQMFGNNLLNLGLGNERISQTNLLTLIIGKLAESYALFTPLLGEPNILAIRFEDLVGARGGGSNEASIQALAQIAERLTGTANEKRVHEVAARLFGGTLTFRKGKIGSWKEEFTAEQKKLCTQVASQLLIDLGYETKLDW